jgi:hypothetical protein
VFGLACVWLILLGSAIVKSIAAAGGCHKIGGYPVIGL